MDPGILFLGIAFLILFLTFQRSSKQRREQAQVQAQVTPGAEVMTASGLFATVIDVSDERVTLRTGPEQTSVWDRRAIARIVTQGSDEADTATEPGSGSSTSSGSGSGEEPEAP